MFYLSADSTLDALDVILGNRVVPALSPGSSSAGTTNVTIPPGTALGTGYYIFAVADAANIVFEHHEGNNSMSKGIMIAAPAP